MRPVKSNRRLLIAFLLALAAAIPQPAAADGFRAYAIIGARIVTVTGETIPKGTVVIRDGLIEAVGPEVVIPPDARVVDASGLTVYPGLIDAHSYLGMPEPPRERRRPGATPQPPPAEEAQPAEAAPSGLNPETMAADLLKINQEAFERARNLGITTALVIPRDGVLPGQSALINLAGDDPKQAIVHTPVALHIRFAPLRGRYPSTLMGVFAYLRQSFLDAGHYQRARAIYERNGRRGVPRPVYDKSLVALLPALERRQPVIMSAERVDEIKRAVALAEEFQLKYIISGAIEGWKITDLLKEKRVPLLVNLNFETSRQAAPWFGQQREPPAEKEREENAANPAALHRAGLRFGFHSGGLARPQDFLANVAKAIEKGLPEEAALRALTIDAAEILGASGQLGSIEPGKIANLFAATAAPWAKNSEVKLLFIDGRMLEVRKEQERKDQPQRPRG